MRVLRWLGFLVGKIGIVIPDWVGVVVDVDLCAIYCNGRLREANNIVLSAKKFVPSDKS